ncbi:MAG: ABC transporter substrate-binding protein, partial [Saccharothrix sp.]|nr:ABC transporter substrate-binding protein [Saccharothrix sp.]
RILEENRRVEGQPHVTIAVLTPLLPTDVGSVTWQRVRAQLEGAHAAQLTANEGKREPKVRLLLANPGSTQQEWRRVVDQLVDLADEQRLVGVIGVGQSTTNTQHTARALAAADLPMVASVVTATDFHVEQPAQGGTPARYIEGFTRVSSTTGNQIGVLSSYLAGQGVDRAMLVYDVNEDDLYTSTLYKEFKAAAAAGTLSISIESRFDTEASLATQFREIMRDLCVDGAPGTVLYAGRAVLLDDLISNLQQRPCARDRNITLVTGSDASMLRTREDLKPRDDQPDLTILYTPHVDPDAAAAMGITAFAELTSRFQELGFDTADLADGWGVMMHDAALAAAEAVSRSANGLPQGQLPTRQAVRAELERSDRERNQVNGAGGTFTIDATTGNAVGRRLPVIEVRPDGAFEVKAIVPIG